MEVINYKITDLIAAEYNPRKIDMDALEQLKKSLATFECVEPAVVNVNPERKGVICGGHQRVKAAKSLGWDEFPCIEVNLSLEKEKELNIRLNKNTGEFDFELLEAHFDTSDLVDWGFDNDDFEHEVEEIGEVEGEDDVPEAPEEPVSKRGDIWLLGDHRLMCGDSTSIDDVDKLMDGNKADMVFTDPPYQLETKGGCKGEIGKGLRKQGSSIEFISNFKPEDFLGVLPVVFSKNIINAYVFCNKELLPDYLMWAKNNKYSFNVLVWKKPNAIPIGGSHRPDIEYLLLFRNNAIWNNALKEVSYSRLIECSRELGLHPTMKPVSVIENQILISSNKGSNILDFFGGSGSTLIACEKTKRKCFMMELDEKYCDVIVKRWQEFTGKEAVHAENGSKYNDLS